MTKKKNWALFNWALKHLKIDNKSNEEVYKKCLRNYILLRLMDLSGVTPADVQGHLLYVHNELTRIDSA